MVILIFVGILLAQYYPGIWLLRNNQDTNIRPTPTPGALLLWNGLKWQDSVVTFSGGSDSIFVLFGITHSVSGYYGTGDTLMIDTTGGSDSIIHAIYADTLLDKNPEFTTLLVGDSASFTDFPRAALVASTGESNHSYAFNLGLVGETASGNVLKGVGVGGVSAVGGSKDAFGTFGRAKVTDSTYTGDAIGLKGASEEAHTAGGAGRNIGVYSIAKNGALNYSFYGELGLLYNTGNIQGDTLIGFVANAESCVIADTALYPDSATIVSWVPTGTDTSLWKFRITDTADTTLQMVGAWGQLRSGNYAAGTGDSTQYCMGIACSTNSKYSISAWGYGNYASENYSTVSGGYRCKATGQYTVVSGGRQNVANSLYACISGGRSNTASNSYATVSGGISNTASGNASAIIGGDSNTASGGYSSTVGGAHNTATGAYSGVYGGLYNTTGDAATDTCSGIYGGHHNTITGSYSYVLAAVNCQITSNCGVLIGACNDTLASDSTVLIGGKGCKGVITKAPLTIGGGDTIAKILKIGSMMAIISGSDTFYCRPDSI